MKGRRARWQRIALGAAEQSGRTRIPEILDLCDFKELVRRPWPDKLKILFWEQESFQSLSRVGKETAPPDSVLLLVGPEGGFSADEASEALRQGFRTVRLGKRILRTETAGLAALSIVQFLWGDMK
jgi:16S rRNA (uracil1498-N3)-methyltransferase